MSQNEKLLPHDHDGIREYDNPLPTWWLVTFFITIIFGFIYWIHFEILKDGPTSSQELAIDLAKVKLAQSTADATEASPVDAFNESEFVKDSNNIKVGSVLYSQRCANCHGEKGQGIIGPNLADSHWIHGRGTFEDVARIIEVGVPEKGMLAWKGIISKLEIRQATAFVLTLYGTQPENPKPPEGQEYKR